MSNIEGFSFEKEGFYSFKSAPVTQSDVKNNLEVLQFESEQLDKKDETITTNYNNLLANIDSYNTLRTSMNMDNSLSTNGNVIETEYNKQDYIPDSTDMIKTTTDIRKRDINTLLLQQNYIYIVGSVTCATLLIAAIVIGRNNA
jgi:hypothetical protein